MLQSLRRWGISNRMQILFGAILLLGIFVRTWEFRTLPPGLHQDEASIGLEAYYLYHYGVDTNNVSFPIHFISSGNGQNAPYAYLLIPFVALFGLSVPVIRLPILLSAVATLPVIYLIFKRTVDQPFALFAMFCIAISPWHILLARWGLESNLLPFFFSVSFLFLLNARDDWRWFIPANIMFAFCLYTYGTTYAFIPLFMLAAVFILLQSKLLNFRQLIIGLLTFGICALPIILFVIINIFGFDSIQLGRVTIPHMPTLSRFQQEGAIFQSRWFETMAAYFGELIRLLVFQDDFRARNVFPPYGYFYQVTFPLAIAGVWALTRSMQPRREEKLLWLGWFGSAFILGSLEPVIINRINIIFIPLIGFIAYFVHWLGMRLRLAVPITVAVLLIAVTFFTYAYHGENYKVEAGKEFYTGFLPALQFAQRQTSGPICISTYKVIQPYIFVLYTEKIPPAQFLEEVQYHQPITPLREVDRLGRYSFGMENCGEDPTTYILFYKERPEHARSYQRRNFDNFTVYLPKP